MVQNLPEYEDLPREDIKVTEKPAIVSKSAINRLEMALEERQGMDTWRPESCFMCKEVFNISTALLQKAINLLLTLLEGFIWFPSDFCVADENMSSLFEG